MRRTAFLLAIALAILALATPMAGAGIEQIDYATYDVRMTDSQGVVTEVGDFGYATGVNILMAYRGDAEVEVPWRRIRQIDLAPYDPEVRLARCTVTLRNGKTVELSIDNVESTRLLKGQSEFGELRIRMGHVRRLELVRMSHTDESLGREAP